MGEGHSCSTSVWQVYPLTAGFSFPVCTTLEMGWAKPSEPWETLNAISRNEAARQKPQVPVFSPHHAVRCIGSLAVCSSGYLVSLLDIHYAWTKGRSKEKRNGWPILDGITRSAKTHVPLHSWILLVIPGAASLQIRAKWSVKKWKHCLPFCKQQQELQSADYFAGINIGTLLLIIIKWNTYYLYVIPRPKAKIVKKLDRFKAALSQRLPSTFLTEML